MENEFAEILKKNTVLRLLDVFAFYNLFRIPNDHSFEER